MCSTTSRRGTKTVRGTPPTFPNSREPIGRLRSRLILTTVRRNRGTERLQGQRQPPESTGHPKVLQRQSRPSPRDLSSTSSGRDPLALDNDAAWFVPYIARIHRSVR